VGLVVPGGITWRASAGRAFRSPSFAELYPTVCLPGGLCTIANPALDPETAWSFELGGGTAPAHDVRVDAALFWTEAENFIEPAVAPGGLQVQFQNLERARIAGLDLSASAALLSNRLTTSVAYTFLYARELAHDTVPERPLAFRPRHLLTLAADYALGPLSVGADFRFMSAYERVELYSPAIPLLSPKVLDLRAGVARGQVEMRLLVANALNYIYNLVPQTLVPVRTATLNLVWNY
jgi:outer membrane receptor protein involved in Fe transport